MGWLQSRRALSLSDSELVQRVLKGDREWYAELVRRHQEIFYRHACGMGIQHDDALDLVQDGFIKAFARLNECHEPAHFRAWTFRIVRNLCLDYLKNVRRLSVPLSSLEHEHAVLQRDSEMSITLGAALDSLPVALREAFLLKHDANYTYEEIADMTDASPSAVKMRVHRARESLREFLVQRGVHAA